MAPSTSLTQSRRRSASLQSLTRNKRPRINRLASISPLLSTRPSFTCTICYQPQNIASPPAAQTNSNLGATLDLASSTCTVCNTCKTAILDLSICWVCGECIVRGDDVVSLGWCFWHRLCFGCLVCNTPLTPPLPCSVGQNDRKCQGVNIDENTTESVGKRSGAVTGRSVGIELDDIPLCTECEGEGESQESATEHTPGFGGGDSQHLLPTDQDFCVLKNTIPKRFRRRPKVKGATGFESELERFINRSSTGYNDLIGPNVSEAYYDDHYVNPWQFGNDKYRFCEDGSTEEPPVSQTSRRRGGCFMPFQTTGPDHDTLVSRQFAPKYDNSRNESKSPDTQLYSSTPPVTIPQPERSKSSRISFADSREDSTLLRAHTIDSLYSSSPSSCRSPINRYPTPFPRIKRPGLDRSDSPNSYFNRSISNHSRLSHSSETVEGMLTLAQFAEHTSTLRKSTTIPYNELAKAHPSSNETGLNEHFGSMSPTSPFSERFNAKTPEPIGEMVERRKREFFKPAVGLVAEVSGAHTEQLEEIDSDIKIDEDEGAMDVKRKVVVDGRRSCM